VGFREEGRFVKGAFNINPRSCPESLEMRRAEMTCMEDTGWKCHRHDVLASSSVFWRLALTLIESLGQNHGRPM
jgi:hypothetical protein